VTPRRGASRRAAGRRRAAMAAARGGGDDPENAKEGDERSSESYDVVVAALSLLLVWGEHAEDMADIGSAVGRKTTDDDDRPNERNLLLQRYGPCDLLLSRACPSALPAGGGGLVASNVANLDLISRLIADDLMTTVGNRSDAALLAARIVKMCLGHASSFAKAGGCAVMSIRAALGGAGGGRAFGALLDAFGGLVGDKDDAHLVRMERTVHVASVMLETVTASVSSRPDLARTMLIGEGTKEDWRLVDMMVSCVMSTSDLMNSSREKEGSVDERLLGLRSMLTCATLRVVLALWKCCRLTTASAASKDKNCNSPDGMHACGTIVAYLTNLKGKDGKATTAMLPMANLVVELTRSSLLAIMSLEERNSMRDEVPVSEVHKKSILLDLLSSSLDIAALETVARVRTGSSQGGIKFVEDLFDPGPMECWKVLLASGDAPASAASSWLSGFSSAVGRSEAPPNWNIASFLRANPPEEDASTSAWCSFGSAAGLARALAPPGSAAGGGAVDRAFGRCNALHVLARGEASFAASWAAFFEVVTANVIATRRDGEGARALANTLAEITLSALSSMAESEMISASLLSNQGLLESGDTKPIGELCSLLLYALTVRSDLVDGQSGDSQAILEMIGRLCESSDKIFAMTQLGSVTPSNQGAVCLIRQRLLTSALVLMSEFESLPQEGVSRGDTEKYKDLRIGFANLAVGVLQSLQYVQDDAAEDEDAFSPSKYGYGFGAVAESSADTALSGQEASLQLLRTSLSLLSRLAPSPIGSSSTKLGSNYQTYAYGVDFAACLKERNAIHFLQYHLGTASTVASLTYQPVYAGSSTHTVTVIHNNAVDVVRLITTFFHALTDTGSTNLDVLLLLTENKCFRSLIDNPLLKTSCKSWTSNSRLTGHEVIGVTRHRGYYTSFPQQSAGALSTSKTRPSSRKDPVHYIWREVITIFSSLLRSVRCQAQTYAKVDEPILRRLVPVTGTVLDFVCSYQDDLFSCFSSMLSEARAQSNLSRKGGKAKSSSFSSSIQSSTFAFTSNLLKESADISSLFAELCKGDIKNEFAHQCGGIHEKLLSACRELTVNMSSFLGSIGNARELIYALSSASTIMLGQQPSAMFDAHPLLADGIPNARHEALRNAHFAHSCCILATAVDFSNSHIATTTTVEARAKDKSLEQNFQIHVNNKFIADAELVAGHCLFNALSVLSDTHPASESFILFSNEEASRLDVSTVISPGTMVAIRSQTGAQQFQRYLAQSPGENVQYARTLGCDRSTRTISVEYPDSGIIERHVPWSCIVGMEDTSRRETAFTYGPIPKSIADADTRGLPSLGHLMLSLKWSRHVASISLDNANNCPMYLIKCVAERAATLLCTEVLLHDELRDRGSRDDTTRKVEMQLLDLFEYADTENTGLSPAPVPSNRRSKSLSLAIGPDILSTVQKNLKRQLQAAFDLREEEQKIWEQNNTGWDNTSFWGSSTKRQGRRSPFRLVRKTSSGDIS